LAENIQIINWLKVETVEKVCSKLIAQELRLAENMQIIS